MPRATPLRFFNPAGLPAARGYSQAGTASLAGLVITSSQLPVDASGAVIGKDDFGAQVEQVFRNLWIALEAAGSSLRHVVRITYYGLHTLELAELARLGEARARHLDMDAPPASAFVYVPRFLHPDILFEAEAIAVLRD